MSSLPVAVILPELLAALRHAPQVLLNAPTGAGKSTWLPLQILKDGNISGKIILLERAGWPRATWRSVWRNC